ncbi:MAG: transcription antitermination factor NusB [Bacteroidia bacterium]
MLSRRQLRVRVMQALYAFFQHENNNAFIAQKEMLTASERAYDLYLQLLLILPEMAHLENQYLVDAPKRYAGKKDVSNSKLENNKVIRFLASNFQYNDQVKKRSLNWSKDVDLLNRIFLTLRLSDLYKDYMLEEEPDIKTQVDFCQQFFKEQIIGNEVFTHEMEDKNVFWAESFEMISSMVVKTIGSYDDKKQSLEIMPMFRDSEEDIEFMKKLFTETIKNNEWFTEIISDKTSNWDVDRIALMDILLLKMALAEVISFENVPVKVSINEYLEISKAYSTPKSKIFINGVIDKLVNDLKEAKKVHKTGRGLVE